MPNLIPINHNCCVWVKLNDTGMAAYRRTYNCDPKLDENGFIKFNSFWQFAECFSEEISTGKLYMAEGDFWIDIDEANKMFHQCNPRMIAKEKENEA